MKRAVGSLFSVGVLCLSVSMACAEYELILKNGRRIAVQSYREEGGMVKFPGLGGEIGIARSEVQAIRKAGETTQPTLDLSRPVSPPSPASPTPTAPAPAVGKEQPPPTISGQRKSDSEVESADERAKEEKEYQNKLAQVTNQLRKLQERYGAETRGTTGPEPSFFTTEEAFKGHQQDLLSRLRAANAPIGPAATETEKRLTELREQMFQLENQRKALIEEMKRKSFVSADMF